MGAVRFGEAVGKGVACVRPVGCWICGVGAVSVWIVSFCRTISISLALLALELPQWCCRDGAVSVVLLGLEQGVLSALDSWLGAVRVGYVVVGAMGSVGVGSVGVAAPGSGSVGVAAHGFVVAPTGDLSVVEPCAPLVVGAVRSAGIGFAGVGVRCCGRRSGSRRCCVWRSGSWWCSGRRCCICCGGSIGVEAMGSVSVGSVGLELSGLDLLW